jgi:hypothetical protein
VSERRRQRAGAALEDARRRLEAGDVRGAVEPLERAGADFAAELDLEGVRSVRAEVERGYHEAGERDEPFYEQLLYATAQNIRFLSRRDAAARGVEWVDPHPELDQPGRPEIRAERGVGRKAKRWLLAVSLGVVVVLGATAAGIALSIDHATIVNDTDHVVAWSDCGTNVLTDNHLLKPGTRKRLTGWNLCVEIADPTTFSQGCLKLHDGETVSVRAAKPCD